MSLDINTRKGQTTLADEQRVARWFKQAKGIDYVQTPKEKPAKVDAILMKQGYILAVAETKCRYDMDLAKLRDQYRNEWLITEAKIRDAELIANWLCVPLIGCLFLPNDDSLLVVNLQQAKRKTAETMTQKTVNGGQIIRHNAYVDMSGAKVYRVGRQE